MIHQYQSQTQHSIIGHQLSQQLSAEKKEENKWSSLFISTEVYFCINYSITPQLQSVPVLNVVIFNTIYQIVYQRGCSIYEIRWICYKLNTQISVTSWIQKHQSLVNAQLLVLISVHKYPRISWIKWYNQAVGLPNINSWMKCTISSHRCHTQKSVFLKN